jgi:hypothetical protein
MNASLADGAHERASAPRILFVDMNVRFASPTRELLPAALFRIGTVDAFGPGYVDEEMLRRGLHAYLDRHPADIVVVTERIPFAQFALRAWGERASLLRRFLIFDWPEAHLNYLGDICRDLSRLSLPKAITLFENDFYAMDQQRFLLAEANYDYFIGYGDQFIRPREELERFVSEKFAGRAHDHGADFFQRNSARTACLLHFVGDNEFCWRPLAERRNDWIVPGVLYSRRERALSELKLRNPGSGRSIVARLLMMHSLPNSFREAGLRLYRRTFAQAIARSRFAYTCGSGLNYPLRKYFEIPALGAVLVAAKCSGFDELGFQDGHNAVVCEPEFLREAAQHLASDLQRAQRIASSGRQLIARQHSVSARSEQLRRTLLAMADRSFAGGRWSSGEYQVARKQA